jgi:hypothetical protein
VKSLHFCTREKLIELHESQPGNIIDTYRTGFVPHIYSGDVIELNERDEDDNDTLVRYGEVKYVVPHTWKDLNHYSFLSDGVKEIKESYDGRDFHPLHYFFNIGIKILKGPKKLSTKWQENELK